MKLVLTCEHGGNEIPEKYKSLFLNAKEALDSHRGYDLGALDLFQQLNNLADFSKAQKVSRLLIETNRSLHHPQIFSEFTQPLGREEKEEIIENYYKPYRNSVEKAISELIAEGEEVLHFSVHSFTPNLNGEERTADIGLLFDPGRTAEKEFSRKFKKILREISPDLKIRYNYPYLGKSDGFTTYLRKKFPNYYRGIELEVNQKFSDGNKMDSSLKLAIFDALEENL